MVKKNIDSEARLAEFIFCLHILLAIIVQAKELKLFVPHFPSL